MLLDESVMLPDKSVMLPDRVSALARATRVRESRNTRLVLNIHPPDLTDLIRI